MTVDSGWLKKMVNLLMRYVRDEKYNIMIFTTQPNFQRLADSRYWSIDGTFATVYGSVQFQDQDSVVPIVFMLLINKVQETYASAFETSLQICVQIDFRLKFNISDFVKAIIDVMRIYLKNRQNTEEHVEPS